MAGRNAQRRPEPVSPPASDRLDSWKEIATYLKREIRTVQRWEKQEGLPVHRHLHDKLGTVYAYKAEVDAWWNDGRARLEKQECILAAPELRLVPPEQVVAGRQSRHHRWLLLGLPVAAVIALSAMVLALLLRPQPPPRITGYTQLTSDGRLKGGPLLTDGSRLYFIEDTPEGTQSLVAVSTAGGDPTPIAAPFREFGLADVSRRRSELLIATPAPGGGALWTLPLAGGTPHRVGDLIVDQAAWSPDGKRIAYTKGRDLYLAKSDGADSRKLVTLPGDVDELSWSPDGKILRLSAAIPGQDATAFWDVAADGTGLHRVLPPSRGSVAGSWTPDGGYFLFSTAISPEKAHLWAFRDHRSFFQRAPREPVELVAAVPIEFESFAPSLDGKKIFAMGLHRRPELARYDDRLKEFVPYLGGIAATWASFSRDGNWVAYLSLPQRALWRAKADGGQPVQLTFAPLEGDGLAWSPDGKQIALRARMPGKPWKAYLVPAEGGAAVPLTSGDKEEGIPTWSRDGKKIVFGDVPPCFGHDNGTYALHVVDIETREVADLPGSKGLWTPRWSPDGRYVAALTIAMVPKLRLFDFTTHRWRELGDTGVNNLTWSHDGKYIYFDGVPLPSAIYRVRISDGKLEPVAELRGTERTTGWGCGLAPDDSPLITREVGFTEIYALDWEAP
jgi:Tol biopolymer transport system component